jgi:hypothetical protein
LFLIEVREGSPLPKKEFIPSHVDWVSHLRLCYSHLILRRVPRVACSRRIGAGVSQIM